MTLFNARVPFALSLLILISFGLVDRATADPPVLGRLDGSGHLRQPPKRDHRGPKPFLHRGGSERLTRPRVETALAVPALPATPQTLVSSSVVVTGFDGIDQSSSFADPPDGAIAVSATYIVEAVNNALSVWTKTYDETGQLSGLSNVVAAADLDAFFGQNPNCHSSVNNFFGLVSDPSLDYDAANDRFMVSMISFDQLFLTSSLCIAVTENGNPSANWFIYAFPIPDSFSLLDFPRAVIGSDGQIYLTGNFFRFDFVGNAVFDHARVYAFKTSDMYVGAETTPRMAVVGNDPESGMPADSLTPARAVGVSGMYFVSASNSDVPFTGSTITLWRWSDPFGSNVFRRQGSVTVSPYTLPPPALQPDALPPGTTDCAAPTAACVETNDARNLAAYWFGNTVWATHPIGCTQGGTSVACVQWYQLGNLDSNNPSLLQQGIVDDPANPGRDRYFPSLAVDRNGNVVLAYAYSSVTEYPGIAYTTISPGGEQGPETVLKAGEVTFVSPRYGDFAGTALDPRDNLTIWHVEEYAKNADGFSEWGTWISAIQIGGTTRPASLSVTPSSQDFGAVNVGSTADRTFVVRNSGGGTLVGSVSTTAPFSIVSGGSFTLGLGVSQNVVVRFSPTAPGTFAANVTVTSNGGDASLALTGSAIGVSGITPSSIDLATPPASFTITGNGFANLGFGLPIVNFVRAGTVLAQARASALTGGSTLTVPFPTAATAIVPNLPGLSAGPMEVQVFLQTAANTYSQLGNGVALTVTDTRPRVNGITPNAIDLATPPISFTITGLGFADVGFGLPVVNFVRNGVLVAEARATMMVSNTTLTVPFPTAATALLPNLPGLSVGSIDVQVFVETAPSTFKQLGSGVALTVTDSRPVPGVSAITPNAIDLATPPASFTITGNGFANLGFGLPMVNFMRNGVLTAQARATALTGSTTLTVPFPTAATAFVPNLPGLSAGTVDVQVFLQTAPSTFSQVGTSGVALTVSDSRPVPGVTAITPSSIDLATPPASFTITGNGFADLGFGLPIVNFVRGATVIAQARATALTGSTTLTVPFPTSATAIAPNLPGLSAGPVNVQVFLQTGPSSFNQVGSSSVTLTVTDSRPAAGVSAVTPSSVDLAAPPASFIITGNGFADVGFGLPMVNFARNGVLLAQARATALTGSTTLTVPFPTSATAIVPNLPGLSVGSVSVQVFLQTGPSTFTQLGTGVTLTVTDSRQGSGITPNAVDLASPPSSFTITGAGFANLSFGLPVVNFVRSGTVLAQARATALTGTTILTVPFPTSATAIAPNLPGLSAGPVDVQVYIQSGPSSYSQVGSSVTLTVTDSRPASGLGGITPSSIDLATPPASFIITGNGFANAGFGLPVVNFTRAGTVLAQARATALTGSTTLTVPFPTAATALAPNLPGLSAGVVDVQVFLQTGPSTYSLVGGSITLTVTDSRPAAGVSAITPSSIDLATPPTSFTITGNGFANVGFGLPLVNFTRGGTVLAQARATGLEGSTMLTVPFPSAATALAPNLPGLSAGPVQVQVYLQTGSGSYSLVGSIALTVTDTRPVPGVSAITPNAIDLAIPPASFTVTGNGFADLGFGLPVVNFSRNGLVLAQARATALAGSTTLTVPFPTAATALAPNLPGLSAGAVAVQVYLQTGLGSYGLLGSVALTITDTRATGGMQTP